MNGQALTLNLVIAWTWILAGFASGAMLGLGFARENWLGGYGSHQRRLYRLGHISFLGLGFVNLAFYLTARGLGEPSAVVLHLASWTFALGAVFMPLCCLVLAHQPKVPPPILFAIPVASLLTGATSTLCLLVRS